MCPQVVKGWRGFVGGSRFKSQMGIIIYLNKIKPRLCMPTICVVSCYFFFLLSHMLGFLMVSADSDACFSSLIVSLTLKLIPLLHFIVF